MRYAPAALMACAALWCLGDMAWASCAEDLTRIQLTLPKVAPEVQSRVGALVSDAEAKAKAKDGAGCDALTSQALQLLNLPPLPPVRLSVTITTPGAAAPSQARGQGETQAAPAGGSGQSHPASQAPTPGQAQVPATSTQNAAPPTAQAAPAPQATGEATGASAQGTHFVSARDLFGIDVRDHDGRTLGWVGNLVLDQGTGRIQYVILESGGFLGWDRNRVVLPYNLLAFGGGWNHPTLLVPASKVENAPRIRERDLEAFVNDPEWRHGVAVYFKTALADNAPGASAASEASGTSGPHPPAGATPTESDATGQVSHPIAQPGEGASGPTASSGNPSASVTTTMATSATPNAAGAPDAKHGQTEAQRACAACHTFNAGGATRVGPNLFGVAERSIAGVPGYRYSPALKSHEGHWDEGKFDAFLKSPRGYAPGTYMTFPGISSDHDRRDVIAYLETLKQGTGVSK